MGGQDCDHNNSTNIDKREWDTVDEKWVKRGWKKCNDCGATHSEWGPVDD